MKGFKVVKNNMPNSSKKHLKGLDSIVTVQEISKANQGAKMVILKNKLSKRAKLRLELENVIKQLKDPSTYLKNIRNGIEDKHDKIIRKDLLFISQAISSAMASKKKSLDRLFKIAKSLYRQDDNFKGSKELRLYLKKLISIIETRIEGLYVVRKRKLEKQRELSRRSSQSPENTKLRQDKDLEYMVMNL